MGLRETKKLATDAFKLLWAGRKLAFPPIPHFAAEFFGAARLRDVRFKRFDDGIRQLEEEGLMQVFYVAAGRREPIVGVVGALQLEVISSRLRSEYGVAVAIEPAEYSVARWVGDPTAPRPSPICARARRSSCSATTSSRPR